MEIYLLNVHHKTDSGRADANEPQLAYSVIIPCYNEEGAIRQTIEELQNDLGESHFEIVVVNDGSSDRSPQILAKLADEVPSLLVVDHDRNRGYGAALKTGIIHARSKTIVITDADGTYPNNRIPELVELARGHDMLVGARVGPGVKYSKIRAIPKLFLRNWASWIAGQNIPDINSGLRVFNIDSVQRFFPVLPNSFSFTTTITLCMLTNYLSVKYEPISYEVRVGKSKIKPIRDTLRFIMLILRTGMYFAPLRVLSPIIALLLVTSIGSIAYDIYSKNLTDKSVMLAIATLNVSMFALLADMVDKRSGN